MNEAEWRLLGHIRIEAAERLRGGRWALGTRQEIGWRKGAESNAGAALLLSLKPPPVPLSSSHPTIICDPRGRPEGRGCQP